MATSRNVSGYQAILSVPAAEHPNPSRAKCQFRIISAPTADIIRARPYCHTERYMAPPSDAVRVPLHSRSLELKHCRASRRWAGPQVQPRPRSAEGEAWAFVPSAHHVVEPAARSTRSAGPLSPSARWETSLGLPTTLAPFGRALCGNYLVQPANRLDGPERPV
jgi:hypothetical protein